MSYKDYIDDEDELEEWEEYEEDDSVSWIKICDWKSYSYYYDWAEYFIGCSDNIFEEDHSDGFYPSDELVDEKEELIETITSELAGRLESEAYDLVESSDDLPPGVDVTEEGIYCRMDVPDTVTCENIVESIIENSEPDNDAATEIFEGILSDYSEEIESINEKLKEEREQYLKDVEKER